MFPLTLLTLLTSAKNILLNPKVLIGIAFVAAITYHFFTVQGLERDLAVSENNYNKTKNALDTSNNTIKSMDSDISQLKSSRNISDSSYIKEIAQLKDLINELQKKPKYTEKIVIKKVPVYIDNNITEITQEKIIQEECSIKVKYLTPKDGNNSIIRIISNIGK